MMHACKLYSNYNMYFMPLMMIQKFFSVEKINHDILPSVLNY